MGWRSKLFLLCVLLLVAIILCWGIIGGVITREPKNYCSVGVEEFICWQWKDISIIELLDGETSHEINDNNLLVG